MSAVQEGYQVYCSGNGRWFAYKLTHQKGFPKIFAFWPKEKKGEKIDLPYTIYSMEIFYYELEYIGWNKTNWLSSKNCHLLVYIGKPIGLSDLI